MKGRKSPELTPEMQGVLDRAAADGVSGLRIERPDDPQAPIAHRLVGMGYLRVVRAGHDL